MSEYLIQGETLSGIADAIRGRTGKSDPIQTDSMANEIASIQTMVQPVVEEDVNFYDYDGTLVNSYTLEEAQALSELPKGPKHDGLTFQGWNWSLEDIKNLTTQMNVGANYITSDGITRLYLSIDKHFMANSYPDGVSVELYLYQNPRLGFVVRWGDGESTTVGTDSNYNTIPHVYKSIGEYVIEIEVPEGAKIDLGHSSNPVLLVPGKTNPIVKKVELGKNIRIAGYSFRDFHALECISITNSVPHNFSSISFGSSYSLKAIMIPSGVSTIATSCFISCVNLRILSLPASITSLDNYSFQNTALENALLPASVNSLGINNFSTTRNMKRLIIPNGVSTIKSRMCREATCLTRVDIPSSVTVIEGEAFYSSVSLFQVIVRAVNPPELQNSNAFGNIPNSCMFYVPKESVESYKQATNWIVYADRVRSIEDYPNLIGGIDT